MRVISLSIITAAALLSSSVLAVSQNSSGTAGFPGFGKPQGAADAAPEPEETSQVDLPIQTIDDSPAMAGFPDGTVLDILGLEPGMTAEEIKAAYTGFDPMTGPSESEVFAANAENGSEASFKYPGEMTASYPDDHYGGERPGVTPGSQLVRVQFGSEAIGGRAIKITREFVPATDEKITIEAYKDSIFEKYGEPSGVDYSGSRFAWTYGSENKSEASEWPVFTSFSEDEGTLKTGGGEIIPECYFSFAKHSDLEGLYPEYEYLDNRENFFPECKGGLYLELHGEQFVERATFISVDHERALQNAAELDRVISERLKIDTGTVNAPQL